MTAPQLDDMHDEMEAIRVAVRAMRGAPACPVPPPASLSRAQRRFNSAYRAPRRPSWWLRARGLAGEAAMSDQQVAAAAAWVRRSDRRDLVAAPHPLAAREIQRESIVAPPVRRTAGGRRTSHRVGRSGAGGGSAGGGDDGEGGGEPEPARFIIEPAKQVLTPVDLAARWEISLKTVQNLISRGGEKLPRAIKIPGAIGPRFRLHDILAFENSAPAFFEPKTPVKRGRGRPRIHGVVS